MGPLSPRRAHRLSTSPQRIISSLKPSGARRSPMSCRQPSSLGVIERRAMSCWASCRVADIKGNEKSEVENLAIGRFVEAYMQELAVAFQQRALDHAGLVQHQWQGGGAVADSGLLCFIQAAPGGALAVDQHIPWRLLQPALCQRFAQ